MNPQRIIVVLALLVVLGVPFVVRSQRAAEAGAGSDAAKSIGAADTIIVVTPHVEQIRSEFSEAFDRWHQRHHGRRVHIDWRAVGGTSEILKLLEAQYAAAAKNGDIRFPGGVTGVKPVAAPGVIGFDLMLGGGSYEHGKLKRGVTVSLPNLTAPGGGPTEIRFPMSVPAGFTTQQLEAWYGKNEIGVQQLYDPDQYWLGTALSGFGIVYNRDMLKARGLAEPTSFADLTDARYFGLLALADPRLSGSVTTTYESILNKEGWERGWRILRELGANARYFASSSTRPPVDVAAGDAAAGLAIDFYGRGQAQAVMRPGETADTCRVGYVDPVGAVYIDADPISILLGGPNPDLAHKFAEFCMTDEAQALWQMPARTSPAGKDNPTGPDGEQLGPRQYELRRMPVRRDMYARYGAHFVDQANPFDLASPVKPRGWRDAIAPLMGAFAIDTESECRAAWHALNQARAAAAEDASLAPLLAEMETAFYAMPEHHLAAKDGTTSTITLSEATYKAAADDTARWRDPVRGGAAKVEYTRFFKRQYERVVELWERRKHN